MSHVIAKLFNTASRRFKIDDPISENENLSPHTFADLKARGFIVAKPDEQPTTQPKFLSKRAPTPTPPARLADE